ncbi:MAG: tetratricopeptide repeat protein [Flavobacteriales bacterium]|nr:tetratricopeptide repeat protein [Flavobacteriales bacterium]
MIQLADSLNNAGAHTESFLIYQNLEKKYLKERLWEHLHFVKTEQADILLRQRKIESALSLLNNLLDTTKITEEQYPDLFSFTYAKMARCYEKKGMSDEAIVFYQKAIQLGTKGRILIHYLAQSYGYLADVYNYDKADIFNAEYYYQKELSLLQLRKDTNTKAQVHNYYSLANVYRLKSDYDQAITYCTQAMQIARATDNNLHFLEICNLLMGNIYGSKGDYHGSLDYYHTYVQLVTSHRDKNSPKLIRCYNNLALSYDKIGLKDSSLIYLEKANNIVRNSSNYNRSDEARYFQRLAEVHQSSYDKAIKYAHQSKSIYQSIEANNKTNLSFIFKIIAEIQVKHEVLDSALYYIQKSLLQHETVSYNNINHTNPSLKELKNNQGLFYSLLLKAEILGKTYQSNQKTETLNALIETYELINKLSEVY